jgi:hypothetical protein
MKCARDYPTTRPFGRRWNVFGTLQAKLIVAVALIVSGFSGGWLVRGWKSSGTANKLKGEVTYVTLERDTCRGMADSLASQLASEIDLHETTKSKLNDLSLDAADREARLDKATADILRYRLENAHLKVELAKPLPNDCEEAVLEAARRIL